MGSFKNTGLAKYEGRTITIKDALSLVEQGVELRGKLNCIECGGVLKFVPHTTTDIHDYFAHVNTADMKKPHKSHDSEGEIHFLAKQVLKEINAVGLAVGGGNYLGAYEIQTVFCDDTYLHVDVLTDKGQVTKRIKPDAIVRTSSETYCIEFFNKHKVNGAKLGLYKQYRLQCDTPIRVIEITITDLEPLLINGTYEEVKEALKRRMTTISDKVNVLDLSLRGSSADNVRKTPFGVCYHCKHPLELAINLNSENYSSVVLESQRVKPVRLVDPTASSEGNRTELGAVALHCPHCIENRYMPIYCPADLKNGQYVPMKLLRNKNSGRYFLACNNYESAEGSYNSGRLSECDCTLTVFEPDGYTLADEILVVRGLPNWIKSGGITKALSSLRSAK